MMASALQSPPASAPAKMCVPDFKASALAYASAGFRVFPCEVGGRKPLDEGGIAYASRNPHLIDLWWSRWPNANIGVATGHGVVVLRLRNPYAALLLGRVGLNRKVLHRFKTFHFRLAHRGHVFFFRWDSPTPVPSNTHLLFGRSHASLLGEDGGLLVPPSRLATWKYRFQDGQGVPSRDSLAPWSAVVPFLERCQQ